MARGGAIWLGAILVGALLVAGGASLYGREVLDERSLLHGLRGGAASGLGPEGLVHGPATLRPAVEGHLPICRMAYGGGKTTRRVTVHDAQHVAFRDGRRFVLPASVSVATRKIAAPSRAPTPAQRARGLALQRLAADEDVEMTCLGPDDLVYAHGCVASHAPGVLGTCPGEDELLITAGASGRLLVDSRASQAVAFVGLALVGSLLIAVGAWRFVVFPSGNAFTCLAGAAAPSGRGRRPRPWHGALLGGMVVVAAVVLVDAGRTEGFYVLACAALAAVAGFIAVAWRRLRAVGRARRAVQTTARRRLADPGDALVTIVARVARDAPRVDSPVAGHAHAFVRFEVREDTKEGKQVTTTHVLTVDEPGHLQVEDDSGRALLSMEDRQLAPRSPPDGFILDPRGPWPAWLAEPLSRLAASPGHVRFVARWMRLERGDPLVLFGAVRREQGGHQPGSHPYLGGDAFLMVFEDGELERRLVRERSALLLDLVALPIASGLAVAALIVTASM